jgi:hypothetical protein
MLRRCAASKGILLPLIGLALLLAVTGWTDDRDYRGLALHDQAIQQSSILIRPGIPGRRPFRNERSRRFMNVPTSDFKTVEGAGSYLFTATCPYSKTQHRFQSAKYLPELSRYLASLGPASVGEPPRRPHAAVQTQAGALPGVDPKFPGVLIIGDSISIGYTAPVTRMLAGKANVRRIPGNGRFTAFGLEHLKDWLGNDKWDVIHFKLEGYDFLAAKVVGSIQAALAGVSAGRPRGAAIIAR